MTHKFTYRHIIHMLLAIGMFGVLFGIPLLTSAADTTVYPPGNKFDGIIYTLATGIGGVVLWMGGGLLNYAVAELVIGMGAKLNGSTGVAIDTLWVLVRDLFNIIFIFGLIYIGFKTILDSEDSSTKKTLGYLIIAALMINFSLFITKTIIDFTNVAATQLYEKTATVQQTDTGSLISPVAGDVSGIKKPTGEKQIANTFMDLFRVTTYAGNSVVETAREESSFLPGRETFYGLLMMFVMLIAGFVLAAGAFLMISRFIALIIFMVLSPVMFLGLIFPLFKGLQNTWWNMFLKYAFVAPAYLFMLYLSVWVIQGIGVSGSFSEAFSAESSVDGSFTIFLNFFIIAGFLVASLKVAQMMGIYGASASMGILQKAGGQVRGFATRGATRVAKGAYNTATYVPKAGVRKGVGAVSSKTLSAFNKWQAKDPKKKEGEGRTNAVGNFTRKALEVTDLDKNIIGGLEAGKNVKAGLGRSYQDVQNYQKERNIRLTKKRAEENRMSALLRGITEAENSAHAKPDAPPPKREVMQAFGAAIKDLTDKQLTEDVDLAVLSNKHVAIHLTNKHIETLEKSGKYSDGQISQIKEKRKEGFVDITTANTDQGTAYSTERNAEWLSQKGTDEMAKMPIEVFTSPAMASYITPLMVEAKMKSGISTEELKKISEAIDSQIATGNDESYTRQWRNWVERTSIGPRLGLKNLGSSSISDKTGKEDWLKETQNRRREQHEQNRNRRRHDGRRN